MILKDKENKVRASSQVDRSIKSPNPRRKGNLGQKKAFNHDSARKNHIIKHSPSSLPFPLLAARAKIRRKVFISPIVSIVPKRNRQTISDPSISMALRMGMGHCPELIRDREIKRV